MNITEVELRYEAARYAAELLEKDELPSLAEVFVAGGLFVSQIDGNPIVSGSLPPDVAEIISFIQWIFRKVDKGDEPAESIGMLLMNRSKIDAIQLGGNDR